ncbi:hypothetical protein VZT92_006401 [Zoarces viviparus]|uniref:Uncharacterized protein n=1 Tax=Zoarces viviparus TaxID=48416 RepID=A0AAW1FSK8_ZOAVI
MPIHKIPVAAMNSFCAVDPTEGSRRQWQDFSSTRTLPLRWRPRHEKLSVSVSQQDRGKGDHIGPNTQQEFHRSHLTSSKQTGRGNSIRDCEPGG